MSGQGAGGRAPGDARLSGVPVVIVNNYPGPGLGGGEVQLLPVVSALLAEGAGVTVVAPSGSGFAVRAADLGASTVEAPMSMRTARAAITAIRAAVGEAARGRRPVMVGSGYFTNLLVRLARGGSAAHAAVANIVGVVPGASRHEGSGPVALAVRQTADAVTRSRVDLHIAVSEAVRRGLIASGADPDRVTVVLNGVDFEVLDAGAAAGVGGPASLSAGPLVACVARLEPVKGVEYFVRAAATVEGAVFAVAGEGSLESRLREIATAQRGGSRVEFLGGIPSAAALMARADVVVVPSLSEAFGLVAAEAMALGRPVVATRAGGLPEVVTDGATGLLVEAGDPDAIAAAVQRLLDDRELASRLGLAARDSARQRFDAGRMSAAYVELLDSLSRA